MKKKLLSLILAASMVLGGSTFAFAADVTRGDAVEKIIKAADDYNPGVQKSDIIIGYGDGKLHEEDKATLAQILIMIRNGFKTLPQLDNYTSSLVLPEGSAYNAPVWAEEILKEPLALGIAEGDLSAAVSEEDMDLMLSRVYALCGSNLKDDFYANVNKKALAELEFMPGFSNTGTLAQMTVAGNRAVDEMLKEIASGTYEKGTMEQQIADYYNTIMDVESQQKEGIAPIKKYLDMIYNADSTADLMAARKTCFDELGSDFYVYTYLVNDDYDNSHYVVVIDAISPKFPEDYYGEGSPVEEAYREYLNKIFVFCGRTEEQAAEEANAVIAFETELAANSYSTEELGSLENVLNYYTVDELDGMLENLDVKKLLADAGYKDDIDTIRSYDPMSLQYMDSMFCEDSLPVLKSIAVVSLFNNYGACLGNIPRDAATELDNVLYGVETGVSDEERAVSQIKQFMTDYTSKLYCEKYFSEAAKADVTAMIEDIIAAYRSMLENQPWMQPETKAMAIKKLDNIVINVGYPEKWDDDLAGVDIKSIEEGGTYFSNTAAINSHIMSIQPGYLEAGPARDDWYMPPYEVNACYIPTANCITFPAGILQKPMYDINAPYEEKLGTIGYVIAHEISHAFDDDGSSYDETGNLNDWWTEEDFAIFEALCEKMAAFYDGKETVFGVQINGYFTLGENVADNGAIQCLTGIVKSRGGDLDTFFRSAAASWLYKISRNAAELRRMTDPHSPAKLRINRTFQNIDAFYEVYDIKEGDAMYVAPEDRVRIW